LRLPGGRQAQRRFLREDTIDLLFDYIGTLPDISISGFTVKTSAPVVVLSRSQKTFEEMRLVPNAVLVVEVEDADDDAQAAS
jgi:hypothetical protein